MKNKHWKRTLAFALALTLVTGVSPVNIGSGGIADKAEIVASAATEHTSGTISVWDGMSIGDSLLPGVVAFQSAGGVTLNIEYTDNSYNNASVTGPFYTIPIYCEVVNCGMAAYSNGIITLKLKSLPLKEINPTITISDGYTVNPSVYGNTGNGTVTYKYNTVSDKEATGWTTNVPQAPGTYYVYAEIAASGAYGYGETAVASFKLSAYAVQFNTNGCEVTAPDTQYVGTNGKATQPTMDTYIDNADMGWNVKDWYENAECTGDAFDFNTAITADTTLYAKWEKAPYTVNCSDDVASAFKLSHRRAKAGDTITLTLKDGYTFNGTLNVDDVTVTKKNGNTYSFTMPAQDVNVSIPANSITKQEYTVTKGNNITSVKIDDTEVTNATVGDTVQFTVDFPKALDENNNEILDEEGNPMLNTAKVQKLTVTGADGQEIEFNKVAFDTYEMTMPAGDISISAEFADIEKYTVFYFGDSATNGKLVSEGISYEGELEQDVVLGGKTVRSMIADATAQDTMKFKYKDKDGWSAWREIDVKTTITDTSNLESQATRLPNGDKVLIVKGETGMVGVSFVADAYSEKGTLNYLTTSGGTVSIPTGDNIPTREGYNFEGWEDRKTGNIYKTGSVTATPNSDNVLVLNAVWKRQNCTVTFDSDGGSDVASATVSYGDTVPEPNDPTKEGYAFAGWVVAKNTGSLRKGETFDFATTEITENLTLKAEWKHVHSYNYYTLDAAIFNSKFEEYYDKYLTKAHIKLCDDWDDYTIEAHHFDEDGKCADCGYKLSGNAFIEVVNLSDGSKKKVRKGATCTLTAPERKDGQVFDCWGYIIGDDYEFNTLSKNRTVSFNVPANDPMTKVTVYPFYKTVLTEPSISMIARPAVVSGTNPQVKAIQFYADYQLPDGWKATDFVMNVGDNDMLFYFKPGSISLWSGFKDSFLNMIGKKKLGGYYCFEKVDDSSLGGKIKSFFKTTFSKVPVYYPREDNVMTSNGWGDYSSQLLADKMYDGKGITVENMELMGLKLNSPGKSGYIYKNVIPTNLGYGLPKDDDRIFYAMGYLKCTDDKGKNHTYIIDAISATANEAATNPVVSYTMHEKTN